MEAFERGDRPEILEDEAQVAQWVAAWNEFVPGRKWAPERVRLALVAAASTDTDAHCSYCDRWKEHPSTIDHFRPKAKDEFPELVLSWDNLYLCCTSCQIRGAFDPGVFLPDQEDYDFDRYFRWNPDNGRIEPREGEYSDSAVRTITHFRWNDPLRPHNQGRIDALTEQRERPRLRRDYRFLWPAVASQ